MSQIIKQTSGTSPGRYALWSTISDDFLVIDCTREELIDYLVEQEKERITEHVEKICDQLCEGKKPYYQFTMTFNEVLKTVLDVHGEKHHKETKDWLGIK